ncbi:MAG: efflux RND transporter periplasmic adaptor subunit [Myxococcota bacterium]
MVLAVLVGVGGASWMLLQRAQTQPEPVQTATTVQRDIVDLVVITGSVVPREEVELKPRVAGVITELLVEPGQQVRKGETIAKIKVVANESSVADFQSRVRAAKLAVADAQRQETDLEALSSTGAISSEEVRAARLATKLRKEDHRAAKDGLRAVKEGALRRGTEAANLVISTVDGTVLAVPVKEGSSVVDSNSFNEGTTVATVADMDDLVFIGWVDESDVGRVRPQMPTVLSVGALDDVAVEGVVERIAPKGEERRGVTQFEVRASVEHPEGHTLRAGYSANARVEIQRRDAVLAIPEKLLQFEDEAPFVEVRVGVEPPQFERRAVTLGLSDGVYAEVLDGVAAEDAIKVPIVTAD